MALVRVFCDHRPGEHRFLVETLPGAVVYDPKCRDTKGYLRPHTADDPGHPVTRRKTGKPSLGLL